MRRFAAGGGPSRDRDVALVTLNEWPRRAMVQKREHRQGNGKSGSTSAPIPLDAARQHSDWEGPRAQRSRQHEAPRPEVPCARELG
jgi:hypothetical protein